MDDTKTRPAVVYFRDDVSGALQFAAEKFRVIAGDSETLGPGMVHVVGGQAAAEFAANHSDQVRSLTLVAPAGLNVPEQDLRRVTAPTLLLWGKDDEVAPVDQVKTWTDRLPKATTLRIFKDVGHDVFDESPEALKVAESFILGVEADQIP